MTIRCHSSPVWARSFQRSCIHPYSHVNMYIVFAHQHQHYTQWHDIHPVWQNIFSYNKTTNQCQHPTISKGLTDQSLDDAHPTFKHLKQYHDQHTQIHTCMCESACVCVHMWHIHTHVHTHVHTHTHPHTNPKPENPKHFLKFLHFLPALPFFIFCFLPHLPGSSRYQHNLFSLWVFLPHIFTLILSLTPFSHALMLSLTPFFSLSLSLSLSLYCKSGFPHNHLSLHTMHTIVWIPHNRVSLPHNQVELPAKLLDYFLWSN